MAMRGVRHRRHYLTLDSYEKETIIKLWNEFKGSGAIGSLLNLPSSTVLTFLTKNGYKRTRAEQLEGYRSLRDKKNEKQSGATEHV